MLVGKGVLNPKTRTTECHSIDMVYLTRLYNLEKKCASVLSWSDSQGKQDYVIFMIEPPGRIRLYYTLKASAKETINMNYQIHLTTTECNYGGKRLWFICPDCHRRSRIIYKHPTGCRFTCRICNNLTYASQQVGYPHWSILRDAFINLPKWQRQYFKTRSMKKRQRLLKKINRLNSGLQGIIDWGRPTRRKRKR